jgi:hypothetical protein
VQVEAWLHEIKQAPGLGSTEHIEADGPTVFAHAPARWGLEGYRLQAQELSGGSAWACSSMSSDKMWDKVADLRGLGFAAPEKMISAFPEIAGTRRPPLAR